MQNSDPLKSADEILDLYNEIFENNTQAAPLTYPCPSYNGDCSNIYEIIDNPNIKLTNYAYQENAYINWEAFTQFTRYYGWNMDSSTLTIGIGYEEFKSSRLDTIFTFQYMGQNYNLGGGPINNEPCSCDGNLGEITSAQWIEAQKRPGICFGKQIPIGNNFGAIIPMDFIKNKIHDQIRRGLFNYGQDKNKIYIWGNSNNKSFPCAGDGVVVGWVGHFIATVSGIPDVPTPTPTPTPVNVINYISNFYINIQNTVDIGPTAVLATKKIYPDVTNSCLNLGNVWSNATSSGKWYLFRGVGFLPDDYLLAWSNTSNRWELYYISKGDDDICLAPKGYVNNIVRIDYSSYPLQSINLIPQDGWTNTTLSIATPPTLTPTVNATLSTDLNAINFKDYEYALGDSSRMYSFFYHTKGRDPLPCPKQINCDQGIPPVFESYIYLDLNGENLYESVTISCDENYNVSADNTNFSNSITIDPENGRINNKRLYFSFDPIEAVTADKNITITSSGKTLNIVVDGRARALYGQQDYVVVVGNEEANISWTEFYEGNYIVILASTDASISLPRTIPVELLSASTVYGEGFQLGSAYVIYAQPLKEYNIPINLKITGITNGQNYYFKIFTVIKNQYTTLNGNINVNQGIVKGIKSFTALTNIISQWTFNSSNFNPSSGKGQLKIIGINTSYDFTLGSPTDPLGPNYNRNNKSLNLIGSERVASNKSSGLEFSVSTFNKRNIIIYWDNQCSATSTKYLRAQYTLDITAVNPIWIDYIAQIGDAENVEEGLYKIDNTSWDYQRKADLSSISEVNNNLKFGFRLVAAYAPGQNGYRRVDFANTNIYSYVRGNTKVDMLTITGETIDPNIIVSTPTPTITPTSTITPTPTPVYTVPTPTIHGSFYFSKINQKLWKSCKIDGKEYYVKYFDINARRFFNENVPDKGWFFYYVDDILQNPALLSFNLSNDVAFPFSGWVNINVTKSNTLICSTPIP